MGHSYISGHKMADTFVSLRYHSIGNVLVGVNLPICYNLHSLKDGLGRRITYAGRTDKNIA